MSTQSRLFSPSEAAAVSELTLKAVNNAIDKKVIGPLPKSSGRAKARHMAFKHLLRLKLWSSIGSSLDSERRSQLFDAIEHDPEAPMVRADEFIVIDVERARQMINSRIDALKEAEQLVHSSKSVMNGEPVFRGTRVPVRLVANMIAGGASVDEIEDGYPSLSKRMIELATIWAQAHPARGRPRTLEERGLRATSIKRIKLADLTSARSRHPA